MTDRIEDHEPWPLRAAALGLLGAVLAVLFDLVIREAEYRWTEDPLRIAAASFLAVAGISFAFTVERVRTHWSALFAIAAGLIVALVYYWNGTPSGWSAGDEWRVFAALLVVAIVAPLFQSVRDAGRWRLDYAPIHAHAWTNIVLWCAAWAFVLISWLLANLLAELFNLIGIDLLREALKESWFNAAIIGAALGGAIGLLRDRDKVLGMLQRVVTTVLSVLAPVLALGLVLFVAALPFTGLEPLWDKTTATTPILLAAVVGAFLLANAVIGNAPEEEAQARAVRLSAMALAAVMAPLAVVAAISTWLRIDQYGFTPERLWAATFVIIVLAISLAYLWTVLRGRLAWADRVRPINVTLALGIAVVALLLSTPLVNFGALSTRDQVARLESGEVKPEEFDWAALRFDFGPSGRRALERFAVSNKAALRTPARLALTQTDRYKLEHHVRTTGVRRDIARNVRVRPAQVPIPPALLVALPPRDKQLMSGGTCDRPGSCTLFWRPGDRTATFILDTCGHKGRESCVFTPSVLVLTGKGWTEAREAEFEPTQMTLAQHEAESLAMRRAIDRGEVEIREVSRRQLFIGGKPSGQPFR